MTKRRLNKIGIMSATITFLIATFILLGYYHGYEGDYEVYGLLFIPVAFVANVVVLLTILLIADKKVINGPFLAIPVMLSNIPYAIFCLWFALYLKRIYRVTLVNDTNSTVSQIQLKGCENKSIQRLDPGESETLWIKINHDCEIKVSFRDNNGITNHQTIVDYLCNGMGNKVDYNLSGENYSHI